MKIDYIFDAINTLTEVLGERYEEIDKYNDILIMYAVKHRGEKKTYQYHKHKNMILHRYVNIYKQNEK